MGGFALNVNGAKLHVDASSEETLLSVLRNRLHLTGTKYGCGEGQCGACTVLLDGRAAHSCMVSVASAASAKIVTIEGLE
ncbi:MAG TPA: 2Fe-2S iron-sulfur cluster-binding protein, partial [Terracidiphilus sp.]